MRQASSASLKTDAKADARTANAASASAAPTALASPQPTQAQGKQLTITIPHISLKMNDEFSAKLPFLALMFLLFVFSLVMFQKANFHTSDVTDLARIQYNMPKVYSTSML